MTSTFSLSGNGKGLAEGAMLGMAAYALCDTLHELSHVAVAWLVQVTVLSISSVGISTATLSPAVALAGPLANALLSLTLIIAARTTVPVEWRYFWWLFGTINLFNCLAYLLYSAVLGSGDWATVFDALGPPVIWRPVTALAGIASYAGAIFVSRRALGRLVAEGGLSPREAAQACMAAYWAGGTLLIAASLLNPISPWLILTSGAATGFGAMAGLVVISKLLTDARPNHDQRSGAIHYGASWWLGCSVLSLLFIIVMGRGLRLSPGVSLAAAETANSPSAERTAGAPLRRPSLLLASNEGPIQ